MSWEDRFEDLKAFRQQNGHCNVPTQWDENPVLGRWVANQRQARKRGQLTADRVQLLNDLGFVWELRRGSLAGVRSPRRNWSEMLVRLKGFHDEYGTADVPYGWDEDPALGRWAQKQRDARTKGELSQDQIENLDELQFEWDSAMVRWKLMFAELLHFNEMHGHCKVPNDSAEWKKLASWVATQRSKNRKQQLSIKQVDLLNSVNFVWDLRPPKKK